MNNERSLAEEITEGFKAMEQLGLAESIVKQQTLDIERLNNHMAAEVALRLELVDENKRLKAIIAQMTIDSGKEPKPAKYTDAWWKEVAEFNKQLKEQNEQ
jgi:hypothetical protein